MSRNRYANSNTSQIGRNCSSAAQVSTRGDADSLVDAHQINRMNHNPFRGRGSSDSRERRVGPCHASGNFSTSSCFPFEHPSRIGLRVAIPQPVYLRGNLSSLRFGWHSDRNVRSLTPRFRFRDSTTNHTACRSIPAICVLRHSPVHNGTVAP